MPELKLNEWKVTDADGATIDKVGKYGYYKDGNKNNPYMFYVAENPDVRVLQTGLPALELAKSKIARVIHDVKIIMPLGGETSGFYRYPKIGEMVLVASDGAKYYLMGYVPDSTNSLSKTEDITDKYGEVLRYKKMGENESPKEYSEIGFYQEKADLKMLSPDGSLITPKIDSINIQSTGDIKSTAVNNYSVDTKRFNLNVNKGNAYIGIDAKGNINITASSVSFTVGRTTVTIKDGAFTVNSKLVNSNLPNSYDAGLKITPRNGFSLFGMSGKISAVRNLALGDGMGGALSTDLGVLSVKGRDISMSVYNSKEYKALTVASLLDFTANTTAAGFHNQISKDDSKDEVKRKKNEQEKAANVFAWLGWSKKLVTAFLDFFSALAVLKNTRAEAAEKLNAAKFKAAGVTEQTDESKGKAKEDAVKASVGAKEWDKMTTEQKKEATDKFFKDKAIEALPGVAATWSTTKQQAWDKMTESQQKAAIKAQQEKVEKEAWYSDSTAQDQYSKGIKDSADYELGKTKGLKMKKEDWDKLSDYQKKQALGAADVKIEDLERNRREYEEKIIADSQKKGGAKKL